MILVQILFYFNDKHLDSKYYFRTLLSAHVLIEKY